MSQSGTIEAPSRALDERAPVTRREIIYVSVVLLLALTLRVTFTYQVHASPDAPPAHLLRGTDMEKHHQITGWVIANGWFEKSADVSPLYPYVVLPVLYKLTGSNVFFATLFQALIDTATVLLIYLLTRRLYGVRAALYAGIGAAAYMPFIIYQGHILGETLLNLLVAAFFLVMVYASGAFTAKRAAAAGLLLGLAVAAKPTCLVFAPLSLLLIVKSASWNLRRSLAPAFFMLAALIVALLPFAWRNYRAVGEFHLVRGNSGIMLYMGNNPDATGGYRQPQGEAALALADESRDMTLAQKDRLYRNAALRFAASNPRRFLGLLWQKFRFFFEAPEIPNNISVTLYRQITFLEAPIFLTFGLLLPFAAVGFLFSIRKPHVAFIVAQIAVYAATIILFIVVGRYRLAVVPLLFPAAGFAAAEFVLAVKSLDFPRTLAFAVPVFALVLLVNHFAIVNFANERSHPNGFVTRTTDSVIIRDDSNYDTPFAAYTLGPKSVIEKALVVTQPLDGLTGAAAQIMLKVIRPGSLTIRLNDSERTVNAPEMPRQMIAVVFPPEAVTQGVNIVDIHTGAGAGIVVYADDVYDYARSLYSPDGLDWIARRFDRLSYHKNPSLHMGGNEFKIRLKLTYAAPPAAQPELNP